MNTVDVIGEWYLCRKIGGPGVGSSPTSVLLNSFAGLAQW